MIEQDDIKRVLDAVRIEDVVSDYVVLTKKGVNLTGLCPFHDEKTSSFTVSPVKGIYKCFGCGKAGNSLNFIMEHEKFTFPEAIRYLADKYKITIRETKEYKKQTKEDNGIYSSLNVAFNLYKNNLKSNNHALKYLYDRGFTDETIEKFGLGYAINSYRQFSDLGNSKGISNFTMYNSGLCLLNDNILTDRFIDRIMFPIYNLSNKIIAFGGRLLVSDKTRSKYINSPLTELYDKSKVLYGLNFAKKEIIKNDRCFLVEGYTDVISLHQAGIENVVSSSGTSLTVDQIKLIYRYTKNITILYDGDFAGIKASFRGIDMILNQGMNVSVILFPNGEDPDSFAKSNNDTIKEYIYSNSKNFISFKAETLLKNSNDDPVKLSEIIESMCQSISVIPDEIYINSYINECSYIMNIHKNVLSERVNQIKFSKSGKRNKYSYPTIKKGLSIDNHEKDIIKILLNKGNEIIKTKARKDNEIILVEISIAQIIISDIDSDEFVFENKSYDFIFNEYRNFLQKGELPSESYFTNNVDNNISVLASELIDIPIEISNSWESNDIVYKKNEDLFSLRTVQKSLLYFKLKKIEKNIFDINEEVKKNIDNNEIMALLEKKDMLLRVKKEISTMITKGKFDVF